MKVKNIPHALDICFLTQDIVPCFVGKQGIGKTQSLVEYGQKNGYDVVVVHLSQFEDVGDLTGLPIPLKEEDSNKYYTVYAKPNILSKKGKKPLLIILDEINQSKPHIRLAAFQLVRHRTIGGNFLGDKTKIVAACNPDNHEDFQVEFFKNAAWEDSFCWIKVDYCHNSYLSYCNKKDHMTSTKMLSFLTEHEQVLKETYKDDFQLDFVKASARSIEEAALVVHNYNQSSLDKEICDPVLDEILEGLMGETVAQTYKGFNAKYITNAKTFLNLNQSQLENVFVEQKYSHSASVLLTENIISYLEERYKIGTEEKTYMLEEIEAQNLVTFIKHFHSRDIISGQLQIFLRSKTFSGKGFTNFENYMLNNKEVGQYFRKVKRDYKGQ